MKTGIILLGLVTLVMLLASDAVLSVNVGSGGEVNQSLVLDQDMSFTGSGLTVTANDITIDCQFHRITGSGSGIGISFLNNNNNVTVKNCVIENFETGLDVNNSNVVLNTSLITNNSRGIVTHGNSVMNTDRNSIRNNTINLENTNPGNTITAINNWWGTNVSGEIDLKVKGNVGYQPYLAYDPYSDEDNDGVILLLDNCPSNFNPSQTDLDFDGKGDACDMNLFFPSGAFDPINETINASPELFTSNDTGYYVIQFNGEITSDNVEEIKVIGGEIFSDLRQNGGIVRISPDKRYLLSNISNIRFVGIYQPAYKISRGLSNEFMKGSLTDSNKIVSINVKIFANMSVVEDEILVLGGQFEDFVTYLKVSIPETKIKNIAFIPDVNYIEITPVYETANDVALQIMNVSDFGWQNLGLTGNGEIIAVMDTGLDDGNIPTAHQDFQGKIVANFTYGRPGMWNDTDGHGTHVAGSVLGSGIQSGGRIRGGAYNARLVIQSMLTAAGGLNHPGLYAVALPNASARGARIHTNSWGVRNDPTYTVDSQDLDRYLWENPNFTILFAAGNERTLAGMPLRSPGTAKNVITVGATENIRALPPPPAAGPLAGNIFVAINDTSIPGFIIASGRGLGDIRPRADNINDIAAFSSAGPVAADGRLKPDIVAPGAWILSTRSSVCISRDMNGDTLYNHNDCVGIGLPGNAAYGYSTAGNYEVVDVQRISTGVNVLVNYVLRNSAADRANLIAAFSAFSGIPVGDLTVTNRRPIPANPILPGNALDAPFYMYQSGTSMATPLTAGTVGLMREYYRTRMRINATNALLKATLLNGGIDTGLGFPDNNQGWGRVNLSKSLKPCGDYKCVAFDFPENPIFDDGEPANLTLAHRWGNYSLRSSEGMPLELTLAWMDPPRAVVSGQLVNDLDLYLFSPSGSFYRGNQFIPGTARSRENPGGLDNINNVEKIIIPAADDGFYKVSVNSSNLPAFGPGYQPYAIIFSGIRGIDSANTTNITYNFTEGDNIYAQAVGLPNDTRVRAVIVAHNSTFKWNRSVQVTDNSGNGINGFKVLNITNVMTTENGTFPERTIIWNTTGKNKDIIEANGTFNIFVNLSDSGPIWFDNRTDVIDYHKKPGLRVAAINSANMTNISYYFPVGSKIYARAVNLPVNRDVRIVTVAHNDSFEWNTSVQVTDNTGNGLGFKVLNISNTRTTANGTLTNTTVIWDTTGKEKEVFEANGTFNMFVNMSGSGYPLWFNNLTDIGDFHRNVGFRVGAISSANRTNLSYYFPAGGRIYANAVGLPNNTLVQIIVVNHSDNIKWDQDIWINPNFTKFADFKVTTSANGTLDNILLWDTSATPVQNILKANGSFNIILDYDTVGNPIFNFGKDIVDFSYKTGFNVSVVDSSSSTGNPKDNFAIGEKVFAKGAGFQEERVNVSVFKDKIWTNGMSLNNPVKKVEVNIDADGKFIQEVLNKTNISDIGGYDIVVDVNNNGTYDENIDVIDGKQGAGFYICGTGKVCSLLSSADSTGMPQHLFMKGDNVYAWLNAVSPTGCSNCRLYVVKSASPISDLDGHTLVDASSNNFETINLPPNQTVNITVLVWPDAERPLGDYELIIDDGDGIFNMSQDGFDPNGFGITREISAPRFAVDSEGNIHVVALLRECCTLTMPGGTVLNNMNITKIIYGKVPANASFTVDVDHPEYFNWSNALTVTNFTTIYARLPGTTVNPPDIAVDMNNEAHIAFGISSSGFYWVTYIKLNKQGQRDTWADATVCDPAKGCTPILTDTVSHGLEGDMVIPACRPLSGGTYLCPGNGLDLLTYWWMDFVDAKLLFPRITIVNGTVPAILTEVDFVYPDSYYLTQIYPSNFIKWNPVILHPLQPPMFLPEVKAGPAQFSGASLQVAIKNMLPDDRDGGSVWPSGGYSPNAGRRFAEIQTGVSNVMAGITGSQGRRDGWIYLPVDEYSKGIQPALLFFNYNLIGEGNRIHVVYTRPENYDRTNYNLDTASKRKLFYQKIDLTGIDLNDSIDDRGDLLNLDPATRKIPVQGSEIKISDDVVNQALPDLDIDSNGIAHFVWQTIESGSMKGIIKYATSDNLNEKIIARTKIGGYQARASIALDSKDNPHISWVDKDNSGPQTNSTMFYIKGKNDHGVVSFSDPVEMVNSSEYHPDMPFFDFAGIMTNRNAKGDWTDRVFLGWLDYNPHDKQYVIKVKKTTPHITMLLVLDGYSADYLMKNLDSMPNLKELLKKNPKMVGTASAPFPGTTFSSQATLFTGLNISNHKIHGDNIEIAGNDYRLFDDPGKVNTILQNENVETIYDYLEKLGKSKAVLGNMYQKGAGINSPDHRTSIGIDWVNGAITNFDTETLPYLSDLKNNDGTTANDAADLITVYLLTNDHGLGTPVESPAYLKSLNESDKKIGEIIGKLKSRNIFNDTIFVITGDHGLTSVNANHSLNNTGLKDPDSILTGELKLNGRVAYYYVPGATNLNSIAREARVLYNNSFAWNDSGFYGKVEKLLVKDPNTNNYFIYSYNGSNDNYLPSGSELKDFASDRSPEIVLFSKAGSNIDSRYYFQSPHRAMWEMNASDNSVPFIITGPGFWLFRQNNQTMGAGVKIQDAGVTASYFVGGARAGKVMSGLDGKNAFTPQFRVKVGSPVNLHLYDSLGRHTGLDPSGNLEAGIPSSNYRVIEPEGKKEITLLQAPDRYRVEVDGTGNGRFTLWIEKNTDSESFSIEYPRMMIKEYSLAQVDMVNSNTMDMQIDLDRDGVFETSQSPKANILIYQNVPERRANASMVLVPEGAQIKVDVTRSTAAIITATARSEISGASLDVRKISDASLDSKDFYTTGSYLDINFSDNLLTNVDNLTLSVNYPDRELLPRGLAEGSLSIFVMDNSTWVKLNSTLDMENNLITSAIRGSGRYVVASSDRVPQITSLEAMPSRTNVPNTTIKVRANITDNDAILGARVEFMGTSTAMVFEPSTGMYSGDLTGPDRNGTYEAKVVAVDINNNTASRSTLIEFDRMPPIITILSPVSKLYTTNTVELKYHVNERSNQSYVLDNAPENDTANILPFKMVSIPLINLSGGNHSVKVHAVDDLGNRGGANADFEIALHNIRVDNLTNEPYYRAGENVTISADVTNTLITPETGIEVQLIGDSVPISAQTVNLSGLEGRKISFNYTTSAGRKKVGIRSVPLTGETYVADNSQESGILVTNKVPVLFVDDDSSHNNSKILAALTTAERGKYDYMLWRTNESGEVTREIMDRFPLVIWSSNEAGSMSTAEQQVVAGYLNNNGYLLASGDNFGKEIGTTGLYTSFLGAKFIKDGTTSVLEGNYRDPIGNGLLLEISAPGEEVLPVSGATSSIIYNGGKSAVIKKDSGFRTVYFAFDANNINDDSTRNAVIERTLKWFNIDSTPPVISNITPPDGSGLPKDTTRINLTLNTDENAECRISDTDIGFINMRLFDITNSLQHSTLITGLQNDGRYTYYIKCSDRKRNIAAAQTSFFVWNRTFLPPVVEVIPDITVLENRSVRIVVNASDPENDLLSYSISDILSLNFPRPFAARFTKAGNIFMYNTTFDDSGSYNLRVTVSDGYANVSKTFRLTVVNVNRPPELAPIGNMSALENTYFYFDVNATDPDGDELRFSDDTPLFDINPYTGIISFTPKLWQVGIYRVNITVSDGEFVDSEVVWFNVTGINHPPVLDFIQPQFARVGVPFNLTLSAHDADGDTLAFSDNTTLFHISSGGQINFTPAISDIGIYYIEIRVSDGKVEDSKILNLVVTNTNTPPRILNITQNMSVRRGQIVEIGVEACDPDIPGSCP